MYVIILLRICAPAGPQILHMDVTDRMLLSSQCVPIELLAGTCHYSPVQASVSPWFVREQRLAQLLLVRQLVACQMQSLQQRHATGTVRCPGTWQAPYVQLRLSRE